MAWECAECNRRESAYLKIDTVCHHCGKLLCREDGVEIADNALSSKGPTVPTAIHCLTCKRKYHKFDVPLSRANR